MNDSSQYDPLTEFALMLIGPPKAGKTVFALNFPDLWILDCDKNLAGALRHHHRLDKKPIKFWFDDPNTVEPKERWKFSVKAIGEAIAKPEVKTIFIDGLTLLGQYLETHILACPNTGKMQDLIIGGEKVMMMELWAPFRNKLMQLMLACRAGGKYFLMSCHEAVEQDKAGAIIGYKPLVSGSVRQNIAGLFTDVWRMETSNTPQGAKYTVRFAPKNLMQIGNSLAITDPFLDVTNKPREQVWALLSTYLQAAIPTTNTPTK